ncbi:MAG: lipid-A-disaccharide synthase [Acidobacteriia bacterium]|nr:lipid-A-disaccharide synthase [Terriglobia bacterium]
MTRPLRIMISAGEASGDRLGAGLARALRRLAPGVELLGMGGDEMASSGVRIVQHLSEVSVVGIVEVLKHLPALRRAMARLTEAIERERPDLVVPVDFPDFNLRLAGRASRAGLPVVYFVSPSVWAWRRGRLRAIRARIRRMLVLFPFEARFYEDAGVPVTFVGHPAVEAAAAAKGSREEILVRAGLDPGARILALLPGSRPGEVDRLFPVMLEAAALLLRDRRDLRVVVPRAATVPRESLEAFARVAGLDGVRIHDGDYPAILSACAAGAVASGTATLEAALAGLPMVVVYRLNPATYLLARLLVRVPHIALPNLVLGRGVVPELIQGRCTAEAIAEALRRYLEDPAFSARARSALRDVRDRLGLPGVFDRAAAAALAEVRADRSGATDRAKPARRFGSES